MRVCFLDESLFLLGNDAVNGARVQILALARELMRRGHEVVAVSGRERGTSGEVTLRLDGVPVSVFERSSRLPYLGFFAASRAVRRFAPDVVYVRGRSYLAGVAVWERRRRGVGFVWASNAEEGCERWKHTTHLWKGPRPLVRKLARTSFDIVADLICDAGVHRADRHVCQTRYQCERLKAVHRREGVVVRSLQEPPAALPGRDSPPLVVWVGRVSVERGPEEFVRLALALADLDCDFALVGPASSEDYLGQVLEAAQGLTHFSYVGEVPFAESWEWIARATVLVNTSPVEGVSNALVQAWHCGTPTVALQFDPDSIIETSAVGFLSGDAGTMAGQVRRLLTDRPLWQAMSTKALDLARRRFSRESVGDAYEDLMLRAKDHV